jgi:hypothetical protein
VVELVGTPGPVHNVGVEEEMDVAMAEERERKTGLHCTVGL